MERSLCTFGHEGKQGVAGAPRTKVLAGPRRGGALLLREDHTFLAIFFQVILRPKLITVLFCHELLHILVKFHCFGVINSIYI